MPSFQVHELPADKLKSRDVVPIDIANDPIATNDYKATEDPQKYVQTVTLCRLPSTAFSKIRNFLMYNSIHRFKSEKTNRGPLIGPWKENAQPVMTCYKLVTCEFKWFGLQSRVESFIQKTERRLFTIFHRYVCIFDILSAIYPPSLH